MLPAWARFLKRWAAAARSSAGEQAPGGQAAAAAAAMSLWAVILPALSDPSPQVAENAVWAAAALCMLGPQPIKEAVHAAHAALTGLVSSPSVPAAVQRAALAALGAAAEQVRTVVGLPAMESLAQTLITTLQQGPSLGATAAAAEGLGLACQALHRGLAEGGLEGPPRQAVLGMLRSLLGTLCALCMPVLDGAAAAATAAGLPLLQLIMDQRAIDDVELLQAVCSGWLQMLWVWESPWPENFMYLFSNSQMLWLC